jgi:hypothetical protein
LFTARPLTLYVLLLILGYGTLGSYHLPCVCWQFGSEYRVRLGIIELLTFLIVEATAQKVDALVIKVDVTERFEVN